MNLASEDWLFVLGALALGAVAAAMVIRALCGDWLVGAALYRATGERRRRCPKCWYDMYGVQGLRCPECGRQAAREGALKASRRRWQWAVAACVPTAGAVALWHHDAQWSERHRYYPTRALVALVAPAELSGTNRAPQSACMGELRKRFWKGKVSASCEAALARKLEGALAGRPLVTVHPGWRPGEPLRVRIPVLNLRPSCWVTVKPRTPTLASSRLWTSGYGSCGEAAAYLQMEEQQGVVLGAVPDGVHTVVFDVELMFGRGWDYGPPHRLTPITLALDTR